MAATVTALVGATTPEDVKVYTDQDTDRPIVVQVSTATVHLSDKAAGALVDMLIEQLTERQSYAPF